MPALNFYRPPDKWDGHAVHPQSELFLKARVLQKKFKLNLINNMIVIIEEMYTVQNFRHKNLN